MDGQKHFNQDQDRKELRKTKRQTDRHISVWETN